MKGPGWKYFEIVTNKSWIVLVCMTTVSSIFSSLSKYSGDM